MMTTALLRRTLRLGSLILPVAAVLSLSGCTLPESEAYAPTPAQRAEEAYKLGLKAQEAERFGRTEEAIDLYRQALDLQPNLRGLWNNLGVLLLSKQRYQESALAFRREAELAPEDPRPYENLGLVHFSAGYSDEALRFYQMSLERNPDHLPSLRGVALAAKRLNRADDALRDQLKRAIMIETDPEWRRLLEVERLRIEGRLRQQDEELGKAGR